MSRAWLCLPAIPPLLGLCLAACQSLDLRILDGADAAVDGPGGGDAARADATMGAEAGGDAPTNRDGGAIDARLGDGGVDCDGSDATICDDFDRTIVIPKGDGRWANVNCDGGGATLGVDGTMNIGFPAGKGGICYLDSLRSEILAHPIDSVGSFQVDFDFTYDTTSASPTADIFQVYVYPPDGGGDLEIVQLLTGGNGEGQLYVLFASDGYAPHQLANRYGPVYWVRPDVPCHITLTFDTKVPSGTATAICGPTTLTLSPADAGDVPKGFAGAVTVSLGYTIDTAPMIPAWTLAFDNLVFRASP